MRPPPKTREKEDVDIAAAAMETPTGYDLLVWRFIALVVMLMAWWVHQTPMSIAWFDKACAATALASFLALYAFLLRFMFPGDDNFTYGFFSLVITCFLCWLVLFPKVTQQVEAYILKHDLLQGVIFLAFFVACEYYAASVPFFLAVKIALAAFISTFLTQFVLSIFSVHIGTPTHVRIYISLVVIMVLWVIVGETVAP